MKYLEQILFCDFCPWKFCGKQIALLSANAVKWTNRVHGQNRRTSSVPNITLVLLIVTADNTDYGRALLYHSAFWATLSSVVRPPFFWTWEGSNYPCRSCDGPNGPKGTKFKQNKRRALCAAQNCRVGVETGALVGQSRPFRPESKSEWTRQNFAETGSGPESKTNYAISTDDNFGRTDIDPTNTK